MNFSPETLHFPVPDEDDLLFGHWLGPPKDSEYTAILIESRTRARAVSAFFCVSPMANNPEFFIRTPCGIFPHFFHEDLKGLRGVLPQNPTLTDRVRNRQSDPD